MAEEEKKEDGLDYGGKLKQLQMDMLDKIGSGGLNQNDLMAVMQMMQKEEPNNFKETMQMAQMMQMMKPQQDPMSQMMPLIMMENMRGDGDSTLNKKIDNIEKQIRENKEEKQYNEVVRELRELKANMNKGDQFGSKEFLTMLLSKDDKMSEMWRTMSEKDREASQRQIETIMKFKDSGTGSIGKIGEQIKEIRALTETMGFGAAKEKSNPEIIKDLVGGVAQSLSQSKGFNDALSGLATNLAAGTSPQVQAQKIQQIQANRQPSNPGAPIPATPAPVVPVSDNPTPSEKPPEAPQTDGFGNLVTPGLIDISSGPDKAIRKPIKQ